ncbi:MAG TPA: hypothetical protein VGN46_19980 [Luteibacter sp.]|jgi:hypothetical protein|uniref:hypothetical protein n=1 Tax=Luteibacter sp. TaxID=1886636 RepID=UPI002F3E2F94
MRTANGERVHHLRRIVAPYVGQVIIQSAVTIFLSFIMISQRAWLLCIPIGGMWLLFLVPVWMGLRYGVSWTDGEIVQRASGLKTVRIAWADIERVATEVTKPGALLTASRPFRRIAIYGRDRAGASAFIDVSLKHFAADDISELMDMIRRRCPGLELPAVKASPRNAS